MNKSPIFSVIMPVYNSTIYLEEAIKSIAKQNFKDLEVIIIEEEAEDGKDIGSTDGTFELAGDLLKNYALAGKAVKRPSSSPKGAGSCRNYGCRIANGQFLAFLDSDDLWLPDHISNIYKYFEEYGQEMGAYCAGGIIFDGVKELGKMPHYGFPCIGLQDISEQLLSGGNFIPTQSLCVRKEVFLMTNGFHELLKCYEDWWFVLQLSKKTKFYINPDTLCRIRVRGDGLSRTNDTENGKIKMSSWMFTDMLRLRGFAVKSGFFRGLEIKVLDNYITGFFVLFLSDLICGRVWIEVGRIFKAMYTAGRLGFPLWPRIWRKVYFNVVKRAVKKLKVNLNLN
ncbi:glycosyltransferase family 2 protein [Paucihalobacter ruber]|uniref:Glycosyltransferase family 2 protein n=1 Tax=Paucihalobacter ruber TaxID=2567861 RepID=A0A506PQA4_9FLAO|nr:glycosyltransferase family A protein [Paucihalobacter ruber]TPV35748.1 glycosyltransferase family 2 protein [Paucihalobacter ruber]